MTASAPIADLARRLTDRAADLRQAELQVDQLIESLFPGWRPRFPTSLGWRFAEPDSLDVYGVADSETARGALSLVGFSTVVLHDHPAVGYRRCTCEARSVIR